ncbi:MAG: chromosomal replication initiator protein DnaA [Chloroflexi bacterium]|nr:chromosomal replication initiator protein DnaA [Chloroflexota bacterium]
MSDLTPRLLWQAVLGELQVQLARASYETFLKETVGSAQQQNRLVVSTSSPFVAEYLKQKLYPLITRTVEKVARQPMEVHFEVCQEAPALPIPVGVSNGRQESAGTSPGQLALNPKYTFETFVVGKSNQLAHAAALAAAEYPGEKYNPVFLYSDVGLGKTHLLHAIGHRARQRNLKAIYVSAERFTNEFIGAIKEGRTEEFRTKYRTTDVLLVDDVQFLIGKEQTQEHFFHTFNELHHTKRQIVLTSDRPPQSLSPLEERLRSRFEWGLIGDIQSPDLETRLALLKAKAASLSQAMAITDDLLLLLGERAYRSVRELEGTLNRVSAFAELTGQPATKELALQAIADLEGPQHKRPTDPSAIIAQVATHFGVTVDALKSHQRDEKTTLARHVAMYTLSHTSRCSPSEIGRLLGGKHPKTVSNACKKIEAQLKRDVSLLRDLASHNTSLAKVAAS